MNIEEIVNLIKFNDSGLVPVIAQEYDTKEVLMLAYMNVESFSRTLDTGKATYWSRSRKEFWVKGETSGNIQMVKEIYIDCDGDTLLLMVKQLGDNGKSEQGAACHKGYRSCFYRKAVSDKWETVGKKIFDPQEVYGKKK